MNRIEMDGWTEASKQASERVGERGEEERKEEGGGEEERDGVSE